MKWDGTCRQQKQRETSRSVYTTAVSHSYRSLHHYRVERVELTAYSGILAMSSETLVVGMFFGQHTHTFPRFHISNLQPLGTLIELSLQSGSRDPYVWVVLLDFASVSLPSVCPARGYLRDMHLVPHIHRLSLEGSACDGVTKRGQASRVALEHFLVLSSAGKEPPSQTLPPLWKKYIV